jgi:hypothetical protein
MSDLREALTAAMAEKEEPETEVVQEETVSEEKAAPAESHIEETTEEAEKTESKEVEKVEKVAKPEKETKEDVKKGYEKAPIGWKAGARERWTALPPEVREEVYRREREIDMGLKQSAEVRKFQESFQQMVEPFRPAMLAEGVQDPIMGIRNLLQTANNLRFGSPIQKADILAELVANYGIDPLTLDQALTRRLTGQETDPYGPKVRELLNQELAPVKQYITSLQGQQQQRQQQIQQHAQMSVQEFAQTAEFFEDVREDMADLMEIAAKRGREMDIKEAYTRACQAHPQISTILGQRKEKTPDGSLQRSKIAASSVKGAPGGGGEGAPKDLRGAIAQAMDKAANR